MDKRIYYRGLSVIINIRCSEHHVIGAFGASRSVRRGHPVSPGSTTTFPNSIKYYFAIEALDGDTPLAPEALPALPLFPKVSEHIIN